MSQQSSTKTAKPIGPLPAWATRRATAGMAYLILGLALAGFALTTATHRHAQATGRSPAPDGFAGPTAPAPATRGLTPGEMRSGALLLRAVGGELVEAPRLGADYDVTVSGPTVRARVTQMFHNPNATHVEAVYVYPLPEGAAVDTLKMIIGERVVIGSINERQAAKELYERAKAEGRKAALLEQERPNIFTNSIANIGPGETVIVQLEYQEPVRQSAGQFSLRIPLVVAPRYNPRPVIQTVDLGGNGWGRSISDPVPDRDRIAPDYLDPQDHAPTNPVTITVRLGAGFPLADVKSAYHPVKTKIVDATSHLLSLEAGAVPADRDFELSWRAAASAAPSIGLFREKVAGNDYVLAFVTPPNAEQSQAARKPREVILVIDNSGSMGGISIKQAKASLAFALQRLNAADRFNVVRFNHTMEQLFPQAVAAEPQSLAAAGRWVEALEATGGTEMLPALRAALDDPNPADSSFLRQVVFLTDGAIGNDEQLLDEIGQKLGRSRVFTVGIGSAPNSYLMSRAAEIGRGAFTHIGSVSEVEARMRALFEKLENTAITGLTASFAGNGADSTPNPLPDLYVGEPVVIAARLARADGNLEIRGQIGDQPWQVTLPLAGAAEGKGLSKLWARRKIADAEVGKTLRKLTPELADKAILGLALEHSLVSRLTSLVAVDDLVSRKPGEPLTLANLPLNLPHGWDFEKVFGKKTGRPAPIDERADARPIGPADAVRGRAAVTAATGNIAPPQLVKSAGVTIVQGAQQSVALPMTATDAELKLLAGLGLLLAGLMAMLIGRCWHPCSQEPR